MKETPVASGEVCTGAFSKEILSYIMHYGARVTAKVVDTHHRRSLLIQGELEIPVEVTVEMDLER